MSPMKRYAKKQAKARQRRRLQACERLARDRRQAQRAAEALHQALEALGLPANLVAEIEGRLRSQQKLLSKIVGVMFPALFGCRTPSELCRVRGWDKNLPARLLRALPRRSWIKRLRRLGLEVLEPIWRHVQDKSPATQSRWQWTGVWDDSVFRKYGEQLRVVGRWWSGQHKRVLPGIDGLLLLVVVGDGRLVVPVDLAMRRPDPVGPGAPCRDKLTWARVLLDERLAAFGRRGLELPAPMGVAASWFGDSKLMQHVRDAHQGTLLVEGKASYCFTLADGRQVKGHALIEGKGWRWQQHPWEVGGRYVWLRATSPTYGQVTVISVDGCSPETDTPPGPLGSLLSQGQFPQVTVLTHLNDSDAEVGREKRPRSSPSVALLETANSEDGLLAVSPAHAGAFQPLGRERLARRFHHPTTNG